VVTPTFGCHNNPEEGFAHVCSGGGSSSSSSLWVRPVAWWAHTGGSSVAIANAMACPPQPGGPKARVPSLLCPQEQQQQQCAAGAVAHATGSPHQQVGCVGVEGSGSHHLHCALLL